MVALLAVGAVVPRKGYDVLIAALAGLTDLPWHLTIAGDRRAIRRLPRTVATPTSSVTGSARACRSSARSRQERLAELYAAADLFVLPSRYEGFGMAYAEAIAHGLPVIGTTAGAIPETVPAGAGVLVPPDDVPALGRCAAPLIETAPSARELAAGARAAAAALPTWDESAKLFCRCDREGRMSGFSAEWLALREPYDRRARNARRARCGRRLGCADDPRSRSVDLACGTRLDPARAHARGCRSGKAGGWSTTISACWPAPPTCARPPDRDGDDGPGRSRARSGSRARRAGRSRHHVGAARSRLARMARPAGRPRRRRGGCRSMRR